MRFGSVCSGIEAASVAFAPLGWRAAWFTEIERFPNAVLEYHYPDVPNLGDMTLLPDAIAFGEVEAPDVLCGGTPCQAFSLAGNRQSLDDARGNLTLTFCEVADAIDREREARGDQPCIILWENVPGVLSTKDNAFGCLLAQLAGEDVPLVPAGKKWSNAGVVLGPKRAVAWRVLDAQHFGVAQRRRRVFVVASARNGFAPDAVLFEREGVRRDTAPSRSEGDQDPRLVAEGADGAGQWWDGGQLSQTLDAVLHKSQTMPEKNRFPGVLQPVAFAENCRAEVRFEGGDGQRTGAISTGGGKAGQGVPCVAQPIAFTFNDYARDAGEVSPTLRSGAHTKASHANSGIKVAVATAVTRLKWIVRFLTPRECERLQGFQDDYTLVPIAGKPAKDGPRRKALGNSWAVPCVRWIGERIQNHVDGLLP